MDGAKVPLTFRIYKGDDLVRTETLSQPVIKIGKLSSSHLRIDDDLVSRMHAVIEVTGPGEISIIDLGSTKGTVVNGQKVNKARLQDGDVIVLGDTRIILSVGEAEEMDDAPTVVQDRPQAAAPPAAAPATAPTKATGEQAVIASSPRPEPGTPPAKPAEPVAHPPAPGYQAPQPIQQSGHGFQTPVANTMGPGQPSQGAPATSSVAPPPGFGGAPAPHPAAPPAMSGPPPQFGMDANDMSGRRSIEVAAMLSDSVIEVKHLTDPKSGKVTGFTWALFGIGGILMLLAAISVGYGYNIAGKNADAYHKWTEVDGKPAVDFRPRRPAGGWDAGVIIGFLGGLIGLAWGLSRYNEERQSPYFRIGYGKEVEFPTNAVPVESFPLVAPEGDDFVFSWAQGMQGEMVKDGQSTPLSNLPSTGPVPAGARIRVTVGDNTFLVSSVPAPARHAPGFMSNADGRFFGYLAGTAAAVGVLLLIVFQLPPNAQALALDVLGNNERLNKVQVKPPEDPKQLEDLSQNDKGDDKSGGTGTKQAGDEGKMGKKDSTRQSGQYAMKNMGVDPQLAKQQAMDRARTAGILGSLSAQQGGAFASLTGTGDFSSGLDDRDVYGGLIGNEVGEMQGGWGYGVRGTGPGGGGTGLGTIGLGNYGTIGHGAGTGSGYGIGSGKGGMRGRRATMPKVSIGNASATGDLDKNIIRRYIRQKLPQIQHCYEKQLVVKPSLAGTVTTQFVINGNGQVISAKAGGLGDGSVENCVAAAIRSIQFPKPTGGGIVNVTYPFTFRPAGG